MSDPLFYQRQWADARLAALRALSDAAHKGRIEEAERRELTEDECWGRDLLLANGICPSCLYPVFQCECELPFSDSREVTG
jgi:hypothetical protein